MAASNHHVVSTWDPFRGGISEKKLWPYMEAMGNRQIKAAELFLFDGRLGAAFLEPLRLVELVMRELIHKELTKHYGEYWMLLPDVIDGRSLEKVEATLIRVGKRAPADRIVSDLNLGLWAGLLQKGGPSALDSRKSVKHKETIWNPALSKVFGHGAPQRKDVATTIIRISYLRNRIAHHEPIIFGIIQPGTIIKNRQLKQEPISAFLELMRIAEYMSPSLAAFLDAKFPVLEMLEENISKQALAYAKSSKNFFWI